MIRSLSRLLVFTAVSATAACGPKGPKAESGLLDSTAAPTVVTDSAMTRDSAGAMGPAGAVPSSSRDSTTARSGGKAPGAGDYIGRDSAFGPSFTVDSTGKITPIVPMKKKP